MFTLETCGAANFAIFCTAARSLSWTCFISQTHAISLWITFDTDFPKGLCLHICFHSTIHICLHESGRFALDPPKLNLVNKRHHGRGVSTKAQGTWIRLVSSDMWCLPLGGIAWLFSSGKHHMSLVNTAFRENFTGSSRYFTLRIFWGLSGPPVVTLSSQFLGALMQISIFNMFWEWQLSKTV